MRRLAVLAALGAALAATPVDAHPGAGAIERTLAPAADGGLDPVASLRRAAARRELGDLEGADDDVARAAASGRAPPALLALERARLAVARGDDVGAERSFADALREARPMGAVEPSGLLVDALIARAARRAVIGLHEEARADLDAAFAARPTADLALARGALDDALGDPERAAQGYRDALAVVDAVVLRRALATLELRRGRWDEVVALADGALRAPASRVDWLLVRADAHHGAGRAARAEADRRAALAEADRALAARPSELRRLTRAQALLALGRDREALTEAEAVLRARPTLREARELVERARARRAGLADRSPRRSPSSPFTEASR